MVVAATLAPKGLGPQEPTKKLSHRVELLEHPLSQRKVFENLGPELRQGSNGHVCRYERFSKIICDINTNYQVLQQIGHPMFRRERSASLELRLLLGIVYYP